MCQDKQNTLPIIQTDSKHPVCPNCQSNQVQETSSETHEEGTYQALTTTYYKCLHCLFRWRDTERDWW